MGNKYASSRRIYFLSSYQKYSNLKVNLRLAIRLFLQPPHQRTHYGQLFVQFFR